VVHGLYGLISACAWYNRRMTTLVVLCAKYLVYVVVAAGLLFLAFSKERGRLGVSAILSMGLAYGLGKVAAYLWYDPRPFVVGNFAPLIPHAANNGFPSDHMLLGAAIASVVFAHNRPLGLVLWGLALAVGAARVLGGIHHTVDLAGSIVIAVAAVAAVEYGLRCLWPNSYPPSSSTQP
jgi:undecaprenyl-diphosphatase